ncbi:MAG: CBS domain-containing protein, partial [Chloroflexota bacterium]|nr:CBS domain-containing protein [Chloroflexota bacterium]
GVRDATKVETIMSTDLITIGPTETLEQALELMVNKSISSLLVVDPNNPTELLGLVTRNSIIKAYESNARKMIGGVPSA